jgi:hypothetical protein
MTKIRTMLSAIVNPAPPKDALLPASPEGQPDRIYHDLIGLSDTDAMWYYELRKWRGRD